MGKILTAVEICRILEKLGFSSIRQRGSHIQYRNPVDGRQTTVPLHKGRDIAPGLSRRIAKDIGMNFEDFWNLR